MTNKIKNNIGKKELEDAIKNFKELMRLHIYYNFESIVQTTNADFIFESLKQIFESLKEIEKDLELNTTENDELYVGTLCLDTSNNE